MNVVEYATFAVVLFALVVAIAMFFKMARHEQIKLIKKFLLNLVLQAEDYFESGEGVEKKKWVLLQFNSVLPWYLKWFTLYINENLLDDLLENAVNEMKHLFEYRAEGTE